jgi:acyl carrier protein
MVDDTIANLIAKAKDDINLVGNLKDSDDIIDDVGLDSLQLINLMLLVENEYDIEVDFDSFGREHLETITAFSNFIEAQRDPE